MTAEDSAGRTRASLLLRLRQQPEDRQAWSEFVRRYGPQLYAWCRRWGLQDSDANDVTQAVLLKLAVRLRTFDYDPQRRFRGWLRRLTHNAWSDWVGARQRAVPGSGDSQVQLVLASIEAREDLAARLEQAFDQELLELAAGRVRLRVAPHTWEAFRLTALEGRSGAEAAATLGMQVGTVFKAKCTVQKLLREEVEQLENEEPPCPPVPPAGTSNSS
jgi:RNA polymerase sigma-70 factor (ECF subfamily)